MNKHNWPTVLAVGFYVVVAVFTLVFIVLINVNPPPIRHNICTIAEISPDITPEERQRCRQMRGHKL